MKQFVAGTLAVLAIASGAVATATPAAAQPWRGGYHHGGGGIGPAIGAGLLGLAVGAAIADHPHYGYGYGPGYVGPGYYGQAYYGCRTAVRWNPYWGGYQRVRACY